MSPLIRGIDLFFGDLDTRQRQGPPSKNRALQKYISVQDTLGMETETVTIVTATPPYHWHNPAGSTALSLIWAMSEWG